MLGGEGTLPCNELLFSKALGFPGNWHKEKQPRGQELRDVCRGCEVTYTPVLLSHADGSVVSRVRLKYGC